MATPFSMPRFAYPYQADIVQRCEDLIHAGIWGGLHLSRLRRWLANFTTDEERYFSACILDSLIFRSSDQTIAMTRQLFERSLPDLLRRDPPTRGAIDDWQESLGRKPVLVDPKIRLVPAVHPHDPPTKSGFIVARDLKRHLQIAEAWIIWSDDIDDALTRGTQVFVFLDDFLGSGDQFIQFANGIGLPQHLPKAYFVYAPLVAHHKGIEAVHAAFPTLRLTAAEILGESSAIFGQQSRVFDDGTNNPENALEFYLDLLSRKGINITGPKRRGYGKLELAYSFEHAAPDNCLPILWWHQSSAWAPLFDR